MSNFDLRHPEDGLLLRYLDGELPGRKARQIRSHLEACWQCRAQVEELQGVIGDCVRYRKNVLAPGLPPPPEPWRSLDFDRVDSELAAQSFFTRLARFLSPVAIRACAGHSPEPPCWRSASSCFNSFAKLPR